MAADTLLADKAFDVDKRVIEPLLAAGQYDKEAYKARLLIKNFFCKLDLPRRNPPRSCYHLAQLRTGPS